MWSDHEKLLASAVWAEDVMVGAVLDELEALSIENQTIVFFSGDNVSGVRIIVAAAAAAVAAAVADLLSFI